MLIAFFLVMLLFHLAIGLAIGYFLLYAAIRQGDWLKPLGLIFGWFIIVLTVIFMISSIIMGIKCRNYPQKYCPMHYMMMKKAYTEDSDEEKSKCDEPCQSQMIQNVNPVVKEKTTPQKSIEGLEKQSEKIFKPAQKAPSSDNKIDNEVENKTIQDQNQ